jgi:hypothetical protein
MPIEKKTVVVLENLSTFIPITEKFVKLAGFQPVIFSDEKEASLYIEENHDKIRLILVCYTNPEEQTYGFIHDIKSKYRNLLINYINIKGVQENPNRFREILEEIPKEPIIKSSLIDWVHNYVKKVQKTHPDDRRFSTTSNFINFLIEIILTYLENERTIEDLQELLYNDLKIDLDAFIALLDKYYKMWKGGKNEKN